MWPASQEVILHPSSACMKSHLEYRVQLWGPQNKDLYLLEQVQRRATNMINRLEHLLYEDSLRELGLLSLETRKLQGDLPVAFQYLKGGSKEALVLLASGPWYCFAPQIHIYQIWSYHLLNVDILAKHFCWFSFLMRKCKTAQIMFRKKQQWGLHKRV